ncbi:MAG: HIT family protein [Nanoarchaeota archaeon]
MNNCVFCKIVNNKIPSIKIYEDTNILAFLDVTPCSKGQTLVIPKKHEGYIFNLKESEYTDLFLKSKKIAKVIDRAFNTIRTCMVIEGFAVDHIHVRLHPCYEKYLNLKPMQPKPTNEELNEIASKIKSLLK